MSCQSSTLQICVVLTHCVVTTTDGFPRLLFFGGGQGGVELGVPRTSPVAGSEHLKPTIAEQSQALLGEIQKTSGAIEATRGRTSYIQERNNPIALSLQKAQSSKVRPGSALSTLPTSPVMGLVSGGAVRMSSYDPKQQSTTLKVPPVPLLSHEAAPQNSPPGSPRNSPPRPTIPGAVVHSGSHLRARSPGDGPPASSLVMRRYSVPSGAVSPGPSGSGISDSSNVRGLAGTR